MTLTIPPQKDPIARLSLLVCAAFVFYATFVSATAPQAVAAQSDPIVLIATPALPTAEPTPALVLAMPTAEPIQVQPVPEPAPVEPPSVAYSPPTPDWAAIQAQSDALAANDPAQNGGAVAPDGCPFPIINGRCANGVLAKTISDAPAFGEKSIIQSDAPGHQTKESK